MKVVSLAVVCLSILAGGCRTETRRNLPPKEYMRWLNDPENGLVKERRSGGLKLTVKYLPAPYLAWREMGEERNISQSTKDSVLKKYSSSLTFLMTIGPDEGKPQGDVMLRGLRNYQEYRERVMEMNFAMEQYITLKAGDHYYKPVLSALENVYGLKPDRSIIFVFADEAPGNPLLKTPHYDLKFEDELFMTGIHHFVFTRKDFERLPEIMF